MGLEYVNNCLDAMVRMMDRGRNNAMKCMSQDSHNTSDLRDIIIIPSLIFIRIVIVLIIMMIIILILTLMTILIIIMIIMI